MELIVYLGDRFPPRFLEETMELGPLLWAEQDSNVLVRRIQASTEPVSPAMLSSVIQFRKDPKVLNAFLAKDPAFASRSWPTDMGGQLTGQQVLSELLLSELTHGPGARVGVLEILLKHGADPLRPVFLAPVGRPVAPWFAAIQWNQPAAVRAFVAAGVSPNTALPDPTGGAPWPSTFIAAAGGHADALQALLDAGATVNRTDVPPYRNPLWVARESVRDRADLRGAEQRVQNYVPLMGSVEDAQRLAVRFSPAISDQLMAAYVKQRQAYLNVMRAPVPPNVARHVIGPMVDVKIGGQRRTVRRRRRAARAGRKTRMAARMSRV